VNPIIQIGRYQIPIGDVAVTRKRTGLAGFFRPGYDVLLRSGIRLRLTNQEKTELDEARGLHEKTIEVLHQVAAMQKNNRPAQA